MAAPRKDLEELRELAVDAGANPASRPGAIRGSSDQLGINAETLRGWVQQAEVDAGARRGTATGEAVRIAELEREIYELPQANAILTSASVFFAAELDRPLR